jgi:hypothetical protein
MTIAATTGATASLAVAGTSLAFAASTQTNGQIIVVSVSIAGTSTVSSISDGTNTYTFRSGITNGSAVRSETWTALITGSTASRTITINFSGSTLASAAYQAFSGSTGIGNIATPTTGVSSRFSELYIPIQDNGSFVVASHAIATSSGDTLTQADGTKQQSIVPALTTAATGLVISNEFFVCNLATNLFISASRSWAATGIELRTGSTSAAVTVSNVYVPLKYNVSYVASRLIPSSFWGPHFTVSALPYATISTPYSTSLSTTVPGQLNEKWWIVAGSLPTGLTLNNNTGVISGTPTVAGNYGFSVWVTDKVGNGQLQDFSISVITPVSTGGSSFVFIE